MKNCLVGVLNFLMLVSEINIKMFNINLGNKEARNLVKDAPKFEFETTASSAFIEELLINDLKRTGDIRFNILIYLIKE